MRANTSCCSRNNPIVNQIKLLFVSWTPVTTIHSVDWIYTVCVSHAHTWFYVIRLKVNATGSSMVSRTVLVLSLSRLMYCFLVFYVTVLNEWCVFCCICVITRLFMLDSCCCDFNRQKWIILLKFSLFHVSESGRNSQTVWRVVMLALCLTVSCLLLSLLFWSFTLSHWLCRMSKV